MRKTTVFLTGVVYLIMIGCFVFAPKPQLDMITPKTRAANMPDFILTATGKDFTSSSTILFNGIEKTTTYISATEVSCEITTEEIALAPATIPVMVRTSSLAGGGDSNTVDFSVTENPTFNEIKNITNSTLARSDADIAVDGAGNINVVWCRYPGTTSDIYFTRSEDQGNTWTTGVNISNSTRNSTEPAIAVDEDNTVNVIWHDTDWEIYFNRSGDGSLWGTPVNVSNSSTASYRSDIAIDDSADLYAVWSEDITGSDGPYEIFFSRSTDFGASWRSGLNISNNPQWVDFPAVTTRDTGRIYVVSNVTYPEKGVQGEVLFNASNDSGATWSSAVHVSNNEGSSYLPVIAVDPAGDIKVAWNDGTEGDIEIFFNESTDGGANWGSEVNISGTGSDSREPSMAVDSEGNINVVWSEANSSHDIYFIRSIDGGINWSPAINLSNTIHYSAFPVVSVGPRGRVYIIWVETVTATSRDIYFVSGM